MPNALGLLSKEEKAFSDKGKRVSLIRSSFPPKLDNVYVIFDGNEKLKYLSYSSIVVGDIICDNENRQRFNIIEIIHGEEMEPIVVEEKKEKVEKKIACKIAKIAKITF